MKDYIGDLISEVQKVCRDKSDCNTIHLGADRTKAFFDNRKEWGDRIKVCCEPGELVELDLPSFPFPVMTNTIETYFLGNIEIVPAYQYHSIVYFFLRRMGMDLFSYGTHKSYVENNTRRKKAAKQNIEEE